MLLSRMKTILYIHGMGGGADSRIPGFLRDWFAAHGNDIRVVVRTYDFNPDRAAAQIDAWYEELRPDLVIGESMGAIHALALLTRRSTGVREVPGAEGVLESIPPKGSNSLLSSTPSAPGTAGLTPAFPLLLVSPALNGPFYFYTLRFLTLIPGVRPLLNRLYKPREGDRQPIDFSYANMRAWPKHRAAALAAGALSGRPKEPGCPGPKGAFPEGTNPSHLWGQGTPAPVHAFFGRRDHYRRSGVVSIRQWQRLFGPDACTRYDGTHYMEEEHLAALLVPAILSILA